MRNLFLMSLFAMFMTVAWGGGAMLNLSVVTSAYADVEDDKAIAKQAKSKFEKDVQAEYLAQDEYAALLALAVEAEAKAEISNNEEDKHAAEEARKKSNEAKKVAETLKEKELASKADLDAATAVANAFHCPGGVASCYRADGSEYIDVNALTATAAGGESNDGDTASAIQVVNPRHFRTF